MTQPSAVQYEVARRWYPGIHSSCCCPGTSTIQMETHRHTRKVAVNMPAMRRGYSRICFRPPRPWSPTLSSSGAMKGRREKTPANLQSHEYLRVTTSPSRPSVSWSLLQSVQSKPVRRPQFWAEIVSHTAWKQLEGGRESQKHRTTLHLVQSAPLRTAPCR